MFHPPQVPAMAQAAATTGGWLALAGRVFYNNLEFLLPKAEENYDDFLDTFSGARRAQVNNARTWLKAEVADHHEVRVITGAGQPFVKLNKAKSNELVFEASLTKAAMAKRISEHEESDSGSDSE
jgi:hypothetical protein